MPEYQNIFKRYEKKYVLSPSQQKKLLPVIEAHMTPDKYGQYSTCSLYYDTPDYRMIRASLENPVYKEKLRLRSYGVPGDEDTVFLEIKKKYKGEVFKRRICMPCADAFTYMQDPDASPPAGQIASEIDWLKNKLGLLPSALICCERTAWHGKDDQSMRLTFDCNIRARTEKLDPRLGDGGFPLLAPGEILMEIKIPGALPLWFSHLLDSNRLYPGSFSKYSVCYKTQIADKTGVKICA